jgi:SCF-associated factor 1
VSAHFEHFIAYSTGSSSVVMMGGLEIEPESQPIIHPELQNRSVISVVIGDYHYGALTSTGKLYTWGQYSKGALGLGDPTKIEAGKPGGYFEERHRREALSGRRPPPPGVTVPTEVRFDHGSKKQRDMFCFGITAAGWHMGALVMDLDVRSFFT